MERETSGAPQNDSPTAKVSGAAPGGPSRLDATRPATATDPTKHAELQLLITFIRKKSDQPNPSAPSEKRTATHAN